MNRNTLLLAGCLTLGSLSLATVESQGQSITLPQGSPRATISQKLGITDVSVEYSRPQLNGREGQVWGQLVPYGLTKTQFGGKGEIPWRAGANENTIITFSDEVSIDGNPLAAGSYGIHMILSEEGETTVIFSENTSSWGSFWYDESEDALRVTVQAEEAPLTDVLTYDFVELGSDYGVLALSWEKLRIPIRIDVDVKNLVLASLRNELRGQAGFTAQGPLAAANYCFQNNINHEEAIGWAQQASASQPSFFAFAVEGLLKLQVEDTEGAVAAIDKSMEFANPNQVNFLAYQLLPLDPESAVGYFKKNVEDNPTNPNFYDSLGEGYRALGKEKDAIKSFRKALSMNPPANVRANAERNLRELGEDI